jgi:hypothetical protein
MLKQSSSNAVEVILRTPRKIRRMRLAAEAADTKGAGGTTDFLVILVIIHHDFWVTTVTNEQK